MSSISTINNFKEFPSLPVAASRSPSPVAYPPVELTPSCKDNTPCSLISRLLHFKKMDYTVDQLLGLNTQENQLVQAKLTQKWRPLFYKGEKSFSLQDLIAELRKHHVLVTHAVLVGEGIFCWTGFSYFSNICTYSQSDLPLLTPNELQAIYHQFQSEAQSPCFHIDIITNQTEAVKVLEMYGAQVKEKEGSFSCWVVSGGHRLLIKIRTPETRDLHETYTPTLHVWSITHKDKLFFENKERILNPLFIFKRQINPLYLKNYPLHESKNIIRLCKEFCHGYQMHHRFDIAIAKEQEAAIRTACQQAQIKGNANIAQGWLDILDTVIFENNLEHLFTASFKKPSLQRYFFRSSHSKVYTIPPNHNIYSINWGNPGYRSPIRSKNLYTLRASPKPSANQSCRPRIRTSMDSLI